MLTMASRFKVAMNRFIDDVSVLAIEDCLIRKVSKLFRSTEVLTLSNEDISRLAGETKKCSLERKRLEEKHRILDTGLRGLKGLQSQRPLHQPAEWDYKPQSDVKGSPRKVAFVSEVASISSSVDESSPMVDSEAPVDYPLEEESESPVAVEAEEWVVEKAETPPDEQWELTVPLAQPARQVRRVKRLSQRVSFEPDLEPDIKF